MNKISVVYDNQMPMNPDQNHSFQFQNTTSPQRLADQEQIPRGSGLRLNQLFYDKGVLLLSIIVVSEVFLAVEQCVSISMAQKKQGVETVASLEYVYVPA